MWIPAGEEESTKGGRSTKQRDRHRNRDRRNGWQRLHTCAHVFVVVHDTDQRPWGVWRASMWGGRIVFPWMYSVDMPLPLVACSWGCGGGGGWGKKSRLSFFSLFFFCLKFNSPISTCGYFMLISINRTSFRNNS